MLNVYVPDSFPKICGCGAIYDERQWHWLEYVGIMPGHHDVKSLELRNCVCGSTIGVHIEDTGGAA